MSRFSPSPAAGTVLTPDLCVVGAGAAGLTAAAGAAAFGASVVLVERGAMGGDCLNYGCVPSKALLAAAAAAQGAREAGRFGVSAGEPAVDFAAVRAHVRGAIEAIEPADSQARFEGLGVTVIRTQARFVSADALLAGTTTIRARRFVLATGSRPRIPDLPGLDTVPYLTNETVFDLAELPRHLVILGGGPVGAELAQAFRRLGSAVTLIARNRCLPREDADLAAIVRAALVREGVILREGAEAVRVEATPGGVHLHLGDGSAVEGSHLLLAAGREVRAGDLGLEVAGIAHNADGIRVDASLRTANRRVYAVGDAAAGMPRFTHAAGHMGGLVLRPILFRLPARMRPGAIPRATYTDPPLGQVGLTEAEARARGLDHRVIAVPFTESDRAWTQARTDGLAKFVVGRRGRLLGVGITGLHADEATGLFALALSRRMGLRDLSGFVAPYPTIAEIGRRAASAYFRPYAARRLVRATVSFLRRFG
ncbi:dihydrolipoyl dehydrogenase family protein [Antarcticirhabdus aurantiaca]|uniref:FAD-dependent oxidoreductase n=1 Tax=Antarcticirhabdus aurantiaca TaxID=2606717 RepID=A0ACD4NQ37_9HYPH|nr:FAD-dependent oxidoreductase [Antarcticirhabdus aurantiaca]WAJ28811.1 FAD-dependent oxidoreductase [Jeongeuplla avenae]